MDAPATAAAGCRRGATGFLQSVLPIAFSKSVLFFSYCVQRDNRNLYSLRHHSLQQRRQRPAPARRQRSRTSGAARLWWGGEGITPGRAACSCSPALRSLSGGCTSAPGADVQPNAGQHAVPPACLGFAGTEGTSSSTALTALMRSSEECGDLSQVSR